MSDFPRYEELVDRFENGLLTRLRGHSAELDYLEMWVPDPDPVRGLLNMAEAAEAAGCETLAVTIGLATLPEARIPELATTLEPFGPVEIRTDAEVVTITVRFADE